MPKPSAAVALIDTLHRGPGATEAGVRSYLRSEYGESSALDAALVSGQVERRGHKLYATINAVLRFVQTRRRPARLLVLASVFEGDRCVGYKFCRVLHLPA